MQQSIEILCDSHHGIFIPQIMINRLVDHGWQGITEENQKDLQDPYSEWYWETWDQVLNNAYFVDGNKNTWQLWQDGDLFCYCDDLMTEEEKQNFFEAY